MIKVHVFVTNSLIVCIYNLSFLLLCKLFQRNKCKYAFHIDLKGSILNKNISNVDKKKRSRIPEIFYNNLQIPFTNVLNLKIKSAPDRKRTRLRYVFHSNFGVKYTTIIKFKTIGILPKNVRPTDTNIGFTNH